MSYIMYTIQLGLLISYKEGDQNLPLGKMPRTISSLHVLNTTWLAVHSMWHYNIYIYLTSSVLSIDLLPNSWVSIVFACLGGMINSCKAVNPQRKAGTKDLKTMVTDVKHGHIRRPNCIYNTDADACGRWDREPPLASSGTPLVSLGTSKEPSVLLCPTRGLSAWNDPNEAPGLYGMRRKP